MGEKQNQENMETWRVVVIKVLRRPLLVKDRWSAAVHQLLYDAHYLRVIFSGRPLRSASRPNYAMNVSETQDTNMPVNVLL